MTLFPAMPLLRTRVRRHPVTASRVPPAIVPEGPPHVFTFPPPHPDDPAHICVEDSLVLGMPAGMTRVKLVRTATDAYTVTYQ